ncbi:efflux RND transporter periplasmic adaptor subunit, partial [Pseudomonas aeruginosa]
MLPAKRPRSSFFRVFTATSITGDIQARVQADQSFRVGGKIVERLV